MSHSSFISMIRTSVLLARLEKSPWLRVAVIDDTGSSLVESDLEVIFPIDVNWPRAGWSCLGSRGDTTFGGIAAAILFRMSGCGRIRRLSPPPAHVASARDHGRGC